jgi:hypothetical protein
MFSDKIDSWLEYALDLDISEYDFWMMTPGELMRKFESKQRVLERERQEKATYDYILGDLIGRSIARIHSSSATYPKAYEAYPHIFNKDEIEEAEQNRTMELSAQRFMAFAESFNEKLADKEGKDKE